METDRASLKQSQFRGVRKRAYLITSEQWALDVAEVCANQQVVKTADSSALAVAELADSVLLKIEYYLDVIILQYIPRLPKCQ